MTLTSQRATDSARSFGRSLGKVLVLVAAAAGVAACSSAPPPTAEQVTRQLTEQVRTATLVTVFNAESDPNKLLGRPNGYLSKTVFADSRVQSRSLIGGAVEGMEQGGSVEVFADEEGATARRNYLQDIGKRLPLLGGEYDFQNGPILVRVSRQLTPEQAAEYETALTNIVSGKSPAPAPAPPPSPGPPAVQVPSAQPGTVAVASVHDAATIVLTDGTRLRQVGIAAPNAETCHAKQATATTEAEVRRAPLTYQLLGQADVFGNQWAYIQIGSVDLGEKLASLGWVWAYPDSPAPQSYDQRIANQVEAARAGKLGLFGSVCPEAATPPQGVAQTPAAPAKTIGDGTYVVGVDIQPGTYRTTGPAEDAVLKMCSWKRLKDTSGEFRSVIATNIAQGPTTVTIKPTDGAFESRGCAPWTKID
jgi:endonuclease YncB( thermonuclease family)